MSPILLHYCLTLDQAGYTDLNSTIQKFLEQANLSEMQKTVETQGNQCVIRFMIEGPETLAELNQAFKSMSKELFSEATKAAIKTLKERPDHLYFELTTRHPSFWFDQSGRQHPD